MKELLSNLGILFIIGGALTAVITVRNGVQHNTGLIISAALVIIGLVLYIILNRRLN